MPTTAQLAPPTPPQHHRFHFLDALRGLAALVVLYVHLPYYLHPSGPNSGALAVDFFFCLSGFVIAFSYERRLLAGLSARAFALGRIIRLYPIYAFATVSSIACYFAGPAHNVHIPPGEWPAFVAAQLLLLPNPFSRLGGGLFPLNAPVWSLLQEVLVSGLYCLLVRRRHLASTWLLALCCGAACLWLSTRPDCLLGWLSSREHVATGFARAVLSFGLGVLLLRTFRRSAPNSTAANTLVCTASAAALVVLCLAPYTWMLHTSARLLAIVVLSPVTVFCGARVHLSARWHQLCSLLGNISFPLYLLHSPVLYVLLRPGIRGYLLGHQQLARLTAVALMAAVLAYAYLAHRFYEFPARRRLRTLLAPGTAQQRVAVAPLPGFETP